MTRVPVVKGQGLSAYDLQKLVWRTTDQVQYEKVKYWTMGELKTFLLTKSEAEIKGIMNGLASDTIACVPKLMTNEELITFCQKIFIVLPGTQMGAKGDKRSKDGIYAEGQTKIKEVEARGADIAVGYGKNRWDLNPQLATKVKSYYDDANLSDGLKIPINKHRSITPKIQYSFPLSHNASQRLKSLIFNGDHDPFI